MKTGYKYDYLTKKMIAGYKKVSVLRKGKPFGLTDGPNMWSEYCKANPGAGKAAGYKGWINREKIYYVITDTDGTRHETDNLRGWCIDNDYEYSIVFKLSTGLISSSRRYPGLACIREDWRQ